MELCIFDNAYFCVNLAWAVSTFLSVSVICCCISCSLKRYFNHKENESKRISDRAKYEFDERTKYEKELNSKQCQTKNEDLNRAIRSKLADAIIGKVNDCDVNLDSAISKLDELKAKL